MDGCCPGPTAVPARGWGVTHTPCAERAGQPEGRPGRARGWGCRGAGDAGGLGAREGWARGVVPPAPYSQLTSTLLFQELKSMVSLLFLFFKAGDRSSLRR